MCALLVYVINAISLYLGINKPENVDENITELAPFWLFWAIHAPVIFILVRRFSFERKRLIKSLLIYSSAGFVWAMLVQGLPLFILLILKALTGYNVELFYRPDSNDWQTIINYNVLIYWIILSIGLISLYYEQYQKEKLKAAKLDVQLSNARLQALQMQLHPHFLFNTLHSISGLALNNEIRDAVKMINRLSELLRLTLDKANIQIVRLEDEIELTRRYLEIEQIRFQDKLTVEMDLDSQALIAEVPTLILQPLVENAMRHGVDSSETDDSRIRIVALLQNDQLIMEVRDNGEDLKKISEQNNSAGLGLKNTRARLSELYGGDYSFILRRESGWTIAQIIIPFMPAKEQTKGESH
jgi:two-component system LytT family sensor kinase